MGYKNELCKAMALLSKFDDTLFIGQSVSFSGKAIFNTLKDVPETKKIETPVFEDVQMGLSIGLALTGFVPVTCFPRFDFFLLAFNQCINHLDKMKAMTQEKLRPKVIVRTSIGSKYPLDGGPQHTADYTKALKAMVTDIDVISLENPLEILPAFKNAYERDDGKSTILIESGDFYNDK